MATAACTPFTCPASCTSIRITSGGLFIASPIASSPRSVSALTVTLPVFSRPDFIAARSATLSSTSRRRMIDDIFVLQVRLCYFRSDHYQVNLGQCQALRCGESITQELRFAAHFRYDNDAAPVHRFDGPIGPAGRRRL